MEAYQIYHNSSVSCDKEHLKKLNETLLYQYPKVVQIIREDHDKTALPKKLLDDIEDILRIASFAEAYTQTALVVINTFDILKPDATTTELNRAAILGWAYLTYQLAYLVLEDKFDIRVWRHSEKTWATQKDFRSKIVIYGALMLQSTTFTLLENMFEKQSELYCHLVKLFLELCKSAWCGNRWKATATYENLRNGKISADEWKYETWKEIALLRLSDSQIFHPLAAGMILAGRDRKKDNIELFEMTRRVCGNVSYWAALMEDYRDCFPHDINVDCVYIAIKRGRISWVYFKAKELISNDEQIKTLDNHYGVDGPLSKLRIKNLYADLELPRNCREIINKVYSECIEEIKRKFSLVEGPGKAIYTYMQLMREQKMWD